MDKALLQVEGRTLLERQVALLRALRPDVVWVSGRTQGELGALPACGLPDEVAGQGPLGGIATILAATRAAQVLVVAVDMPALTEAFLAALIARRAQGAGVVPRTRAGWEPAAAIYPRELLAPARAALAEGRRALHALVDEAVAAGQLTSLDVSPEDERLLKSWNTPEDRHDAASRHTPRPVVT